MKKLLLLLTVLLVGGFVLVSFLPITLSPKPKGDKDIQLDKIRLPEGFQISLYAEEVDNARSMAWSPNGILYVGNRGGDKVYALVDTDKDFKVDAKYTVAEGLNMPNGVAWRDGDLYIAEVSRISKLENIDEHLDNPPSPVTINDTYPSDKHHGWKFIAFGPDNKLYVPVGAPCNICEKEDERYASITRMDPDGSNVEVFVHGVRNTVGFTWHPETQEMWFTDNGRDWLGDDLPACELNHAPKQGMHFGFPYCHQGDTPDPKFGDGKSCADFTAPAQNLGPHVAALGVEFGTGDQFPEQYQSYALIAEHGSWNRSERIGYRVTMVKIEDNKGVSYEPFAEGWLQDGKPWGRPVDLEFLPDGSMLVSDDFADAIYRITYSAN
ncbi:MAG: PQQ-dependent sugar dehydrogenase [Bacteroidota bacterium]